MTNEVYKNNIFFLIDDLATTHRICHLQVHSETCDCLNQAWLGLFMFMNIPANVKSGTIGEIFWLLPVLSPLLPVVSHFSFVNTWKRSHFSLWFQSSGSPECIMGDDLHINKQTNIFIANHRRLLRQNN